MNNEIIAIAGAVAGAVADELERRAVTIETEVGTPTNPFAGAVQVLEQASSYPETVLIRTVTMHYTGRIVGITDTDICLEDAAWIADAGRFTHALETGTLSEVEPYPSRVWVSRGAIVDITEWTHPLPRDTK